MKYIASPYTHTLAFEREARAMAVCEFTAELLKAGVHAFSPIAHGHLISKHYGLPPEFAFHEKYDQEYMDWCDELIVLMLEDWQLSVGVNAEIQYMREQGKNIVYACCAASYLQAYYPETIKTEECAHEVV